MPKSPALSRVRLSDALGLVKRPIYILGTTYSMSLAFFESVVLPCINRGAQKSCLILSDRIGYDRALSEGPALLGVGQDYMVVPSPLPGAFHAKVWLLLGESSAVLLVGSGNLTQAGFMTNEEFFDVVHMDSELPPPSSLRLSVESFLGGLRSMCLTHDEQDNLAADMIQEMITEFQKLPVAADEPIGGARFVHSFAGPLLDQLPDATASKALMVAAPYFGNSTGGLDLLASKYKPRNLRVFPAVHDGCATDLPAASVKKRHKQAEILPLHIEGKPDAFRHLKLYGLVTESDSGWLFCGSANCTLAAWQGPNIEAGLLRAIHPDAMGAYFRPGKGKLPEDPLRREAEKAGASSLLLSAIDEGGGLTIKVSAAACDGLPLRNVTLTLRKGSHFASCSRPTLFDQGRVAHIPWSVFSEAQGSGKQIAFLDMVAVNAQGEQVHGACFVDNRLMLTAEPGHRSAFRGALALLDAEGAPELADISAIFAMARDVFDGSFLRPPPKAVTKSDQRREAEEPEAIAIWPPRPDVAEIQRALGRSGTGQLLWFQRVLQTLLRGDSAVEATAPAAVDDVESDKDDGAKDAAREQEKAAVQTAGQQAWRRARGELDGLRSRLCDLCPSQENAAHIWPAVVFSFLAMFGVYRVARRVSPDSDLETNAETLTDEFIRLMLNPRKQDDDFVAHRHHRYREQKFPPLADDLHRSFGIRLHPDLSVVMMALVADMKRRTADHLYPQMWQRYRDVICSPRPADASGYRESSLRVWRRFVRETGSPATDAEFLRAFDAVMGQT